MSTFEFDDGTPTNGKSVRYENFKSGTFGGWTKEDFVYSVNVHQRAFGAAATNHVMMKTFGTCDPSRIPSFAFGPIIAALASEMADGRPHKITRSPLYAGKEK